MPVPNECCRDRSLRAIITYKRPFNECAAECKKPENRLKKLAKPQRPRCRERKPKKSKNRCFPQDKSCPQWIERIALPRLNKVELTLQTFGGIFDTERVINVCRFIHNLQNPQPPLPQPLKKAKKKKRYMRAKAVCKSKKLKAQWQEKQSKKSTNKFIRYLVNLRSMIPNYKQLQVTMKLYKTLNFRRLKTCNRYVKEELKIICQKLAILIDVKLQPYKQEFVVDQMSRTTMDDKHCVFKMFEYVAPESEEEIEYQWEEEGKGRPEESLYMGEETWMPELEIYEIGEEGEGVEGGEGLVGKSVMEGEGGFGEEEEIGLAGEDIISEGEGMISGESEREVGQAVAEEEEPKMVGSEEFAFEEELLIAEELEEGEEEEEYYVHEEEVVVPPKVVEEEESVMIGEPSTVSSVSEPSLPDTHPDGTSSYVDWCLYISWLKELGRNIEMYASCLHQFKATLQADEADKFVDTLKFILTNWSNYLAESRRVDQAMTEYFKDKPMTLCKLCRDCTIDDYPQEHFIPPELVEVIHTTKTWRRLLLEAEEYCNMLSRKEKGEEGEEVEEVYEIFDVASTSSSSFDVVPLDRPTKSRSRSR